MRAPCPVAAVATTAVGVVVAVFAALGFAWWQAYPGAAGALLGRHREPATRWYWVVGQPRRPRPRRRADAAGGLGRRLAAR